MHASCVHGRKITDVMHMAGPLVRDVSISLYIYVHDAGTMSIFLLTKAPV